MAWPWPWKTSASCGYRDQFGYWKIPPSRPVLTLYLECSHDVLSESICPDSVRLDFTTPTITNHPKNLLRSNGKTNPVRAHRRFLSVTHTQSVCESVVLPSMPVKESNPRTYGAWGFVEHFRSILPDSPLSALGDVLALKAETDSVTGARVLLAQVDATDRLVKLAQNRDKSYWSIEMAPNMAGTGKAYMLGLSVTDTPASLGTELIKLSAAPEHRATLPEGMRDHLFGAPVENGPLEPDTAVDVHTYAVARPLVESIIRHENGRQPYPDAVIDKGLALAGIEPPVLTVAPPMPAPKPMPRPLHKTSTGQAGGPRPDRGRALGRGRPGGRGRAGHRPDAGPQASPGARMMPGWVISLAGWLGRIALAAGAALFALRSARQAGRAEARDEAHAKVTHAHHRMLDAAADRPRDRDALVDRLRDGRF